MSETVVFSQLSRKFIDQNDNTPADAQQVIYYGLAIGHHLGVIDCLEAALTCPWEDYLAWIAVGGQPYFAEAHVLCILAPRFHRNFWKYRNHPKAYRVCILDVGHLSQTLLLSATEAGLGSYVTAAINEIDIERALGLESWSESPLAVCGIGPRANRMETYELDPNRRIWSR